jgi:cytochrome c
MKPSVVVSVVSLLFATAATTLLAADRGTPLDAKSMLAKAVAHYKIVGANRALADFTGKLAPFNDRDLYVVCIGPDLKITASGGFPEYVGLSADIFLKDADGNSIAQKGWDVAMLKGEGEIHYNWFNPATLFVEKKITFFARTGDNVCGVGAYEPL